MDRIKNMINDIDSNVRVYLLKKIGYKGQYEAVLFPNSLDQKIKDTYAENYEHFCGDREIKEYDSVHSEKGTIKQLPLADLSFWNGMREAIAKADKENSLLNKQNFTDDYSVIVLVYEKVSGGNVEQVYLIAQYRKVESWYKRSVKFGFVANTIQQKDEEIFALNGCIDTVIAGDDVFVLQETAFEKVFNYYEKSKRTVAAKKTEIEKWHFLDNPEAFYADVSGKKGPTTKLARALEKAVGDFSQLEPTTVRHTLSQYDEFKELTYDEKDRIKFAPSVRDLIIDILRHTYARHLFSDILIHTKGV